MDKRKQSYSVNSITEQTINQKILKKRTSFIDTQVDRRSNNQSIHSENFDLSFDITSDLETRRQTTVKEFKYQSKVGIGAPKPENVPFESERKIINDDRILAKKTTFKDKSDKLTEETKMYFPSSSTKDQLLIKSTIAASKIIPSEYCLTNTIHTIPGLTDPTIINLQRFGQYRNEEKDEGLNEVIPVFESPKSESESMSASFLNQVNLEPASPDLSFHLNHVELQVVGPEPRPQIRESSSNPTNMIEARIFLRRVIVLFFAIVLSSFILIFVIQEGVSVWALSLSLYCYWVYVAGENMFASRSLQRQVWRRKDDFFRIFDALSAIVAQACINLKISNFISYSSGACVPFMIMTIIYSFVNKPPKTPKYHRISLRCFYSIQILFITLKLDGILEWKWSIIFTFLWMYMGITSVYFLVYTLLFLFNAFVIFSRHLRQATANLCVTLVGLGWHSTYYGLGVVGILFLSKLTHALEHENYSSLWEVIWLIIIMNVCLAIYTTVFLRYMLDFLTTPSPSSDSENVKKKTTVRLEVQKKNYYFIMVSRTYFLPLDSRILIKNHSRLQGIHRALSGNPEEGSNNKKHRLTSISIETLQQYKKTLDKKLKSINVKRSEYQDTKKIKKIVSDLPKIRSMDVLGENIREPKNPNLFTVGDDSPSVKISDFRGKITDEENLCYLCFEKNADSILMNCGHGGICYDCAKALVQKNTSCMECRAKIDMIHRVDPKPKMANIIKSFECIKVF